MKTLRKVDCWIGRHMSAERWVMVWLFMGAWCLIGAITVPELFFKVTGSIGAFCAILLVIANARRM